MHVAFFKHNNRFASLYSKLLFLFPCWLVLQNLSVWYVWNVETYKMEVMTKKLENALETY